MTDQETRSTRRPGCLARLFVVLLSVLFSLLLLEIGARVLYSSKQRSNADADYLVIFQPDEKLEWTHAPNRSVTVEVEGQPVLISTNGHGLRDIEYEYTKPPDTFRILVLGDSYTEAVQVNLEQAYHTILEERLNATGAEPHIEVLNGGVSAYGVTRATAWYEEEGRRYEPDLVLLAYYMGNDMRDDHPALAQIDVLPGLRRQQFFEVGPDGALREVQAAASDLDAPTNRLSENASLVSRLDAVFFANSRLYFYLRPLLTEQVPPVRRLLYNMGVVGNPYPVLQQYAVPVDPVFEEAWRLQDALIARLDAAVRADGARFVVLIIPDWVQVQPDLLINHYPLFYPEMLEAMDFDQPDQALIGILERHNIQYLYLRPGFAEQYAADGQPLYGARTEHWNPQGHALAAAMLYDWLLQTNLVPGR